MFQQLGQMANLLKQAQQFSGKFQSLQATLAEARCTGTDDDHLVEITLNGQLQVLGCRLSTLANTHDTRGLEAAIVQATSRALASAQKVSQEAMSEITGGMDLGALQGLLGKKS